MEIRTLGNVYSQKENSFDEMRFILASLVLFVHSYVLLFGQTAEGTDPFTKLNGFQISPGTIAVYGFFILSGFFMIQSIQHNTSLWKYFRNRILRIVPAFWLSVFISCFILAPLISETIVIFSLEPGSSLYFFIKSIIFQFNGAVWTITNLYPLNPVIDNVNGSIWTLKYEVIAYILLPIIYVCVHKNKYLIIFISSFLTFLSISYLLTNFILFNIFTEDVYFKLLSLLSYFFIGATIYLFKDKIIISKRLFSIFLIIIILGVFYGNLKIILFFALPYILIFIPVIIKFKFFSKFGDYSYGMYIYAFPIQQTLVHFFKNNLNAETLFITSFIITLILSILSWHFFEKKILKLKKN